MSQTERSERRESVLARLRVALYEADGHLQLSECGAWLQTRGVYQLRGSHES
jgi:hypothetical protein